MPMQGQMSQVLVAAPSKQQVILPISPQKVQTCSQGEQQPLWRRGMLASPKVVLPKAWILQVNSVIKAW